MKRIGKIIVPLVLVLSLTLLPELTTSLRVGAASTGTTELVSVSSDGTPGDKGNDQSRISHDGRYVYFSSHATNLVPSDTNGAPDIFVRDRLTGTTRMLSVNSAGVQGNYGADSFDVSDGGRYLVFSSGSNNLTAEDYNSARDIYLRDLKTGVTSLVFRNNFNGRSADTPAISGDGNWISFRTQESSAPYSDSWDSIYLINRHTLAMTRVSNGLNGAVTNNGSYNPDINYDGSTVVFSSQATNLVNGDTNGQSDVFLWSKDTPSITRVSVSSAGDQANHYSQFPRINGSGNRVVFESYATNLTANGTASSRMKAYMRQVDTNATSLVNVTPTGQEGNAGAQMPDISEDGNYIVFASSASDLVSNDTNGKMDVFMRDITSNSTSLASLDNSGAQFPADTGGRTALSAEGQYVTFNSSTSLYLRY